MMNVERARFAALTCAPTSRRWSTSHGALRNLLVRSLSRLVSTPALRIGRRRATTFRSLRSLVDRAGTCVRLVAGLSSSGFANGKRIRLSGDLRRWEVSSSHAVDQIERTWADLRRHQVLPMLATTERCVMRLFSLLIAVNQLVIVSAQTTGESCLSPPYRRSQADNPCDAVSQKDFQALLAQA